MTLPATADLLAVWESARGLHPLARALALLAASEPGAGLETLAALPLGEIHRRSLSLFERWCGPDLEAYAQCPSCAERLEVPVALRDLRPAAAEVPGVAACENGFVLAGGGLTIRFRLPAGLDLLRAARSASPPEARLRLLQGCVIAAERDGVSLPPADLGPAAIALLGKAMEGLDPGGDPRVEVACAACGHLWELAVDPGLFLWQKLDVESQRLLHQVDTLARIYHWRERDILRMSPARRQSYLRMAAR
jgi:hypothetical protein